MRIPLFSKLATLTKLVALSSIPFVSYGLGALAHNYVANESVHALSQNQPALYKLIQQNKTAYLIGSDYPDVGYVPGATFGEDSHWQPFVNAYLNYLNKHYPKSSKHRDKLLAFLLGATTHIKSDIISHWTYYKHVAKHDFKNQSDAWDKAHHHMDYGSDFYAIVKQHVYTNPLQWWVPISDLQQIYQGMGLKVKKQDLIRANIIYYLATGLVEDLIAFPGYAYLTYYKTLWGMTHWQTPSSDSKKVGAFPEQIHSASHYLVATWQASKSNTLLPPSFANQRPNKNKLLSPFIDFATKAINKGWLQVETHLDKQGNLSLSKKDFHYNWRYTFEQAKFIKQLLRSYRKH